MKIGAKLVTLKLKKSPSCEQFPWPRLGTTSTAKWTPNSLTVSSSSQQPVSSHLIPSPTVLACRVEEDLITVDALLTDPPIADRKSEFIAHAVHVTDAAIVPHLLHFFKEGGYPLTADCIHPRMYAFRIRSSHTTTRSSSSRDENIREGSAEEKDPAVEEGEDEEIVCESDEDRAIMEELKRELAEELRKRRCEKEKDGSDQPQKTESGESSSRSSADAAASSSAVGTMAEESDDDGETGAGRRILQQLRRMEAEDVLIVASRWYGGANIGSARFRHIQTSTEVAVENLFAARQQNLAK